MTKHLQDKSQKGVPFPVDPGLAQEISLFGAKDMENCMQCGNCSASCPLSTGHDTFPRKIYRYLQLGLRDKLKGSAVPWLCYYCGECNTDCPRGAEPAETMMAVRRWLTTQYDWTGLAKRLYLSEAWEFGALGVVSLLIILLFVFFHGPVITDRVAVNTFAPVIWIEIGDLVMAGILSAFLLSNAFRMFRYIMDGTRVPLRLYITEAKSFVLHFATQKRWRKCSEDKTRWLKHFLLVTGYMTMMTLIIGCIRWFQVDDSSWHFTSIFGYYATAVLLYLTVDMFISRLKKKETIHRFSEPTDWLFLVLLFLTTLTGIIMHLVRLAGWPMGTYVTYVIHLAIAVPMLVIEVPFGKWSHLFYRPLAIFLTTVREKALEGSRIDTEMMKAAVGETFLECMQCGTCSGVCPAGLVDAYSPRSIMRQVTMDTGTGQTLDEAVWQCVTCNTCNQYCPRGIDIIDVSKQVRRLNVENGTVPEHADLVLSSLKQNHNPWNGTHDCRTAWAGDLAVPRVDENHEYCLFTCCTTAYKETSSENNSARALVNLMRLAGIQFGTLGDEEYCCGDPVDQIGGLDQFKKLRDRNSGIFIEKGISKMVAVSPHCYHSFTANYPQLSGRIKIEHYTQLLDRLIQSKRLVPAQGPDCVVTFHDPCYLGRHHGIYDVPRQILKSIPGLTLVEMANHKENSLCCGGGGGNAFQFNMPKTGMNRLRIEQALSAGAGMIVTACPFCSTMLNQAVETMGVGKSIRVMDLAVLLGQVVNVKPDDDEINKPYKRPEPLAAETSGDRL